MIRKRCNTCGYIITDEEQAKSLLNCPSCSKPYIAQPNTRAIQSPPENRAITNAPNNRRK